MKTNLTEYNMGLPKGFKKKVDIINIKQGPERRQDYLDEIDYKGTYIPKGISYEDIDKSFIDFIDKDLSIEINGDKVPVIFLTIQKWAEFSKTWEFTDKYKNFKMPFITIVRKPDIQVGTNQAGNWNIPGNKLYTYIKVPTFVDGRKGIDTYKIPQPTSVDVNYEVRLFCNRMKDLNTFNQKTQLTFQSRQYYMKVNEHPIPIHLEDIGDESKIDDFDSRRFYVQSFEMKVLGYIISESDYEVIPSINRNLLFTEIVDKKPNKNNIRFIVEEFDDDTLYKFDFESDSSLEFTFISDVNIRFTKISNIINTSNIIIKINGNEFLNGLTITTPININIGDSVTIKITRNDENKNSLFNINGKIEM